MRVARALRGILVREFDIRAGNALMYFPEANVLVPTITDPLSKTPGFKGVLVTVVADESSVPTRKVRAGGNGAAHGDDGRVSLEVVGGA